MAINFWTDQVQVWISCGCDHGRSLLNVPFDAYYRLSERMAEWPATWLALTIAFWSTVLAFLGLVAYRALSAMSGRGSKTSWDK